MAGSTISAGNKTTRFQSEVVREYVREGRFGPDIGNDLNSIIQTNRNLKKVSIPLVAKLGGAGVEGSATLVGNEESLSNYDSRCSRSTSETALPSTTKKNELAEFDLFSEARPALMNWVMELKRDEIIQAMGAVPSSSGYFNYGGTKGSTGSTAASAANMDTWNSENQDRVLYGAAKANNTSGNHTASLATIDTTNDKLDADMVGLLKRMAKQASPLIRPVMLKGDEPWFKFYVGSYAFRDLRADLDARQQNALPRNINENPIWSGGDLVYDGVIIKEVPEIDIFIDGDSSGSPWDGVWGANASGDSLATGGDTSSRVGIGFFCGAQSVGFGIGRDAAFKRRKEDDYEFQKGVGVQLKHDLRKTFYNNKQHGMITSFHSAAADS